MVDDSNDNYYGKTKLQFVQLEDQSVTTVKLDKDGMLAHIPGSILVCLMSLRSVVL